MKSQHILKQRLAGALMIALAAAGCASGTKSRTASDAGIAINGNVKYGTFARESLADLNPEAPLTHLYVAGKNVLGYTRKNTVYALSGGLEIRYIQQLAADDVAVLKPVAYGDDLIFPMSTQLKVLDGHGQTVRTIRLPHPLTSEVRLDQRGLLLAGTIAPTGGRVSVIDPQLTVRPIVADTLIGSVFSAPVGYQGIIYAATDAGSVYAIGPENRTAWPLDNMSFATSRSVKADLVIDEYGLFVASSDTKLYALDRATGQIKWRYMAEVPLTQTPLLTADRVYIVVGNRGLVAIDKVEGKLYREPLWTTPGITKILSTDADYLYAVQGTNKLVAIGIKDGAVKFDLTGDFSMFAADGEGRIYAANTNGVIATFVRKPYTGDSTASAK